MKELITIQKREKLNRVFVIDEPGAGNANHKFLIVSDKGLHEPKEQIIEFQHGGRNVDGSTHGVCSMDLLEIVRHNIQCFQTSEYACRENAIALTHIEEALLWLNKRSEDRMERGVLGINQK